MKDQPSQGEETLSGLSLEKKRALLARALANKRRKAEKAQAEDEGSSASQQLLVCFEKRAAPRLRLLCFPALAGSIASFASWSHKLPAEVEVYGAQLPRDAPVNGKVTDEALASLFEALLEEASSLAEQPLALLGESMGAWWACAMAEGLEKRGVQLAHLFVIAAAAPPSPDAFPMMEALDDDQLFEALRDKERSVVSQDPAARQQLLSNARNDARWAKAIRGSLARETLRVHCPLSAWGGREDHYVPTSSLLDWQVHTKSSFSLHLFPGGHGFLHEHTSDTLQVLGQALALGEPRRVTFPGRSQPLEEASTSLAFGLFFFSCNESDYQEDKYELLLETVAFAERQGFRGVWLPERHFHPVGGLFPSPSVLASALSQRTSRLRLRAGSVVLPLHDPIRVAEEWSVVDNLSQGRVELSVVPGWNPNDFALSPDAYETRLERTFAHLETVRTLWRGEPITRRNGCGEEAKVWLHPKPCQPQLPFWVTTSSREESFVRAGELGANLLTALLTQSTDELKPRIDLYRQARQRAGHDPSTGRVALMVHTFVGESEKAVRETIKAPFMDYMHSVQALWKDAVDSLQLHTPRQRERVIEMVYERYFQHATLFGTVQECIRRAQQYQQAGVDEIACAIDFGVPLAETITSLSHLDRVRRHFLNPPHKSHHKEPT